MKTSNKMESLTSKVDGPITERVYIRRGRGAGGLQAEELITGILRYKVRGDGEEPARGEKEIITAQNGGL